MASFPCFLTTQTQLISSATHYQYTSRIITLRLRGSKQLAGRSLGRKVGGGYYQPPWHCWHSTGINISRFPYFLPVGSQAIMAEPMIIHNETMNLKRSLSQLQPKMIGSWFTHSYAPLTLCSLLFEPDYSSFRFHSLPLKFGVRKRPYSFQSPVSPESSSCGPIPFFQCLVSRGE